MCILIIYYSLVIIGYSESAKILAVFPTPSISHQIVFRPLMAELAKRGHQVVVITTDPEYPEDQTPNNLVEVNVHDISYKLWNDFVELPKGSESDQSTQIKVAFELLVHIFEAQVKSNEVQRMFNDKKHFDIIFVEALSRPALIFSHLYSAPVIQFSSFGGLYDIFEDFGAPIHPILYPVSLQQRIYNLTLWEKITEYKLAFSIQRIFEDIKILENTMLKSVFGSNTPDVSELRSNIQMLFLNVHPIWDSNRPVPPNVLYLGGLHQKSKKGLPQDLQEYLDSSMNGVIYMSFGTNIRPSLLPPEKIKIFTRVFSQLPYNVLMKWDKDDLIDRSNNTKIFKWVPQSDLLRHPNIKLFITQGGLQSTDECISAGVPLLGVPMLGDQWYNTEQYVIQNIGIKLSIGTLTEENLKNAINSIIEDESYRKNIVKLRDIMRDQPQTPLQRAVWWTEYVLRHGHAKHLRASGFGVTSMKYFEVDLIITLLLAIIVSISSVVYLIKVIRKKYTVDLKTKLQ